jgi:hypothetical protein
MGIPVIEDEDCPPGQMYFLNTKYLTPNPFQDDSTEEKAEEIIVTGITPVK